MYDAYWLAVIVLIIALVTFIAGYFYFTRTRATPPPPVSKPPGYTETQLYTSDPNYRSDPNYPLRNRPPGPPFVP